LPSSAHTGASAVRLQGDQHHLLISAPPPPALPMPQCPGGHGLNRGRDEAASTSPRLPRRGRRSGRNEPPASPCPWEGKHGCCLAVPISAERGAGAGSSARAVRAVHAVRFALPAPEHLGYICSSVWQLELLASVSEPPPAHPLHGDSVSPLG